MLSLVRFLSCAVKIARGAVGIDGKQQGVAAAIDVGNIHAAVGADEAVMGLGDEHAVLAADDGAAFAQSEFDDAGIEVIFLRPGGECGRWFNRCKIDDAAFRFGNDLVFDDENVAGREGEFIFAKRLQEFVGDRIAGADFVGERDAG